MTCHDWQRGEKYNFLREEGIIIIFGSKYRPLLKVSCGG
jgi:hypothetical protein